MRNTQYVHIIRIISCEKQVDNEIGKLKRIYSDDKDVNFNTTHLKLIKTIQLKFNYISNFHLSPKLRLV